MENRIDLLVKDEKKHLNKYKKYIRTNDWIDLKWDGVGKPKQDTDIRKEEFNLHNNILNTIISRLKSVGKKSEGSHHLKVFKDYVDEIKKLLELHKQRAEDYTLKSDILEKTKNTELSDLRSNEIDFHRHLHQATSLIWESFDALNLKTDDAKATDGIEFYDNVKAPLSMLEVLVSIYPQIQKALDLMKIDFTSPPKNEMLINMKDVPKWNVEKHFWEQDRDVLQFYVDEFKKIRNGINIDGVYISGWAYYHINVFVTPIPHKIWNPLKKDYDSVDKIINPPLRDSDWMLFENRALQEKTKTLFMFVAATRRAAKTTAEASMLGHAATIGKKELLCAGANAKDLGQLAKNFKTDTLYKNPAFAIYNVANDWTKKVEIGIKTKNQKTIPLSTLHIINTDDGNNKEIFAGFTPDIVVGDEQMKSKFLEALEGLIPAMQGTDGMIRAFGMLSGCVCAGTKVFTKSGKLVNIENLKQEEGIIGQGLNGVYKSDITWMKPPTKKPCYKITTTYGMSLECSDDHPILTSLITNPNRAFFEKAKDLKIGSYMFLPEKIDVFGEVEEKDARLLGLLVGDGYNAKSGSELYINGEGVYKWLCKNYKNKVMKSFQTKQDTTYRRIYINNSNIITKRAGIINKTKQNKILPVNWSEYNKESLKELIGGLFDSDGSMSYDYKKNSLRYRYRSISKDVIYELQTALLKLGIHSSISLSKEKTTKINNKEYNRKPIYELSVSSSYDSTLFCKTIKLYSENKIFNVELLDNLPVKNKPTSLIEIKQTNNKGLFFKGIKDIGKFRRVSVLSVEYIGEKNVYNLTADTTHTYIANNFITHNTGGTEKLSEDGYKALSDPDTYDVLPMQWDILERGIKEEFITWKEDKGRPFGTFIPGQCRVDMPKIKSNLADYLGVKSETLKKVDINITDWEKSLEIIKEKRKKAEKDRLKYQKEVVYCPIKPSEIFMSGALNPFPVEELRKRKQELIETGDVGKKVTLIQKTDGKIIYELSSQPLAEYPHKGGFVDAPVVLYEELPENTPPRYLYVCSLDDYKQEESDTDSVGSFHVYKVNIGEDKWKGRIVASLATRPDPHLKFYRQIYLLQQAFNAVCFMENADDGYKQYLEKKHVANLWLQTSLDFKADSSQASTNRRKYGWTPTPANIRYLKNLAIQYTKEEFTEKTEDGKEITITGVQKLNDIGLIQEMIDYREGNNVDRITSFMSCLGLEFHYYTNWMLPKLEQKKTQREEQKPQQRQKTLGEKMFGTKNRGFF